MLKRLFYAIAFAGVISLANAAPAGQEPQTSNEHGVKVTVTPPDTSRAVATWDFEVMLETHTQPLDDDLARSSVLIIDKKPYQPLEWNGAPPGGHHRKGSLRFKVVTPLTHSVELQIRLSGETAPRRFQWTLKGAGNGN